MVGIDEACAAEEAAVMDDTNEARVPGVWTDSKPLIRTAIFRGVVPFMMETKYSAQRLAQLEKLRREIAF